MTAPNSLTPEEYLRLERASEGKHEYVDGQMLAMAGANRRHRRITANIQFVLQAKEAASGCVSDSSETRLFIPATKSYTYPDVVMTCGEEQRFQDDSLDTLLNPTLIVEVLSPSTEAYDRGKKFNSYVSIPSFVEYLLVSQDEVLVEQRVRLAPQPSAQGSICVCAQRGEADVRVRWPESPRPRNPPTSQIEA